MKNPRHTEPWKQGDPISASKLESMRLGAMKRIRGLLGRESAFSASHTQTDQSIRERIEVLNNTGQSILEYSLFAVKKSGDITYPWGPPVRTEAFRSEVGFDYVTNEDFTIADKEPYSCLPVGYLPVLVRYSEQVGVPKIGHPVGPLEDGSVSIQRCGFVVIAEPDTANKRVWVVRSNDQMVRVILKAAIADCARGDGKVVNACGGTNPDDPNTIDPGGEFVLREILNLTGTPLVAGETVFAEPTLGLGYIIRKPEISNGTIFLGRLAANLCAVCSDTPNSVLVNVVDGCGVQLPQQITAINWPNTAGYLGAACEFFKCGPLYYLIVVKAVPHNVAIEDADCGDFGVFIKQDNCTVQGYSIRDVPLNTCKQPAWNNQFVFPTASVFDNLSLEYDPGAELISGGQGSEEDPCANPTLKLKGRTRTVVSCDDCPDQVDPSAQDCQIEDISTLTLYEQTAFYVADSYTNSAGQKCVRLWSTSFVVFNEIGSCGDAVAEDLICGNPCPESPAS